MNNRHAFKRNLHKPANQASWLTGGRAAVDTFLVAKATQDTDRDQSLFRMYLGP